MQRGVVEIAKEKINKVVANHFDINTLSGSLNLICVADLGCSTGPNTFISVQNIKKPENSNTYQKEKILKSPIYGVLQ